MPKRSQGRLTVPCANCQGPVGVSGRRPASGKRFCQRRECRAAYYRSWRREQRVFEDETGARHVEEVPMEGRPCSNCGAAMSRRPQRVTDSSLGRWCMSYECQKAKRSTLAAQAERDSVSDEEKQAYLRDLENAWRDAEIVTCRCGREDARVRFIHPTPDGKPCTAEGQHGIPDVPDVREWTREHWGI